MTKTTKDLSIIEYNIDILEGLSKKTSNLLNLNLAVVGLFKHPEQKNQEELVLKLKKDLEAIQEKLINHIDLLKACDQETREAINA